MHRTIARRPVAQRLREWLIARCLAPINIGGAQVQGITIDGDSVGKVTMDGDVVFGGIPDDDDLHARYDATELSASDGDSISTWPDETGNGFDLTAGTSPTYNASAINGYPAVGFDGADDNLDVSFSSLSQPNHVFIVARVRSVEVASRFYDGATGGTHQFYSDNPDTRWTLSAGVELFDGDVDTNNHIHAHLFNETSSVMRLDGTETASGDAGTSALDGFTVGARGNGSSFADVLIGEILIYPQDKTGIVSDVESYLSDKWGIAI